MRGGLEGTRVPDPAQDLGRYFSFRIQRCPRPHARIRIEIEFARSHVSDTYLDSVFHPGLPGNINNSSGESATHNLGSWGQKQSQSHLGGSEMTTAYRAVRDCVGQRRQLMRSWYQATG